MKSIKPGRGPSRQAAAGSIVCVFFGVIWTIMALFLVEDMGVIGMIFPMFGLVFIGLGVYNAVYHYKNATGDDPASLLDIVDSEEEPRRTAPQGSGPAPAYCPWCGERLAQDYQFCPKCGRKLPGGEEKQS